MSRQSACHRTLCTRDMEFHNVQENNPYFVRNNPAMIYRGLVTRCHVEKWLGATPRFTCVLHK